METFFFIFISSVYHIMVILMMFWTFTFLGACLDFSLILHFARVCTAWKLMKGFSKNSELFVNIWIQFLILMIRELHGLFWNSCSINCDFIYFTRVSFFTSNRLVEKQFWMNKKYIAKIWYFILFFRLINAFCWFFLNLVFKYALSVFAATLTHVS